jgi:mRNA interferase RelE/StbE
MPAYSVVFKPSVEKDISSLPKSAIARVLEQIERMKTELFSRQVIKLSGAERLYRIRVGDYRIVYEVNVKARQVMIHYVRHRREVYRSF